MINLFNLKNSILAWLAGASALLAIFTIRKGGRDAEKHKQNEKTLENITTAKRIKDDIAGLDNDERNRLRNKWTRK